jgi:mono/diheme cytochrome c family protein
MTLSRMLLLGVLATVPSQSTLAQDRGRVVYEHWCQACHGAGPDKPGTAALQAKYKGSVPALLEQRNDLTAEVVKVFVRRGVSVMPPFRKTEIPDDDLNALASYLSKRAQ